MHQLNVNRSLVLKQTNIQTIRKKINKLHNPIKICITPADICMLPKPQIKQIETSIMQNVCDAGVLIVLILDSTTKLKFALNQQTYVHR